MLDLESFNLLNVGICWKEFVSYVVGAWKNQVPIPDVEGMNKKKNVFFSIHIVKLKNICKASGRN